jgi:hypothetical protein
MIQCGRPLRVRSSARRWSSGWFLECAGDLVDRRSLLGRAQGEGAFDFRIVSLGIDDQRLKVAGEKAFDQSADQGGFSAARTAGHKHVDSL